MLKERFDSLIEAIRQQGKGHSADDIKAVEDYIKDCGKYIEAVTNMEAAIAAARFYLEPEDYRQYIMQLDRSRKLAHDALIASTRLINRLCRLYGQDQIYTGEDSRIAMADFAAQVVQEYFAKRKL